MLISPEPDQEGNKLGIMSGTRAISATSRRELSSIIFFLQDKALKEIHDILTETLACFLPGRVKDLSASLLVSISLMENLHPVRQTEGTNVTGFTRNLCFLEVTEASLVSVSDN